MKSLLSYPFLSLLHRFAKRLHALDAGGIILCPDGEQASGWRIFENEHETEPHPAIQPLACTRGTYVGMRFSRSDMKILTGFAPGGDLLEMCDSAPSLIALAGREYGSPFAPCLSIHEQRSAQSRPSTDRGRPVAIP